MLREEVTALVENTLRRTHPGAVFTMGVLAALSLGSPSTAGAAVTGGAVAGKGVTALAKDAVSGVLPAAAAGSGTGLLVGWMATKAVRLTARSERERICITQHCRWMIFCSFALCAVLALVLSQAGELFPVTSASVIFGILAWVGALVATILGINSRMQREVRRIRAETGTQDTTVAN